MNFDNFSAPNYTREQELAMAQAMPILMRKVYTWMTMALIITGIAAYWVSQSVGLMNLMFSSRLTFFLLIGTQVGIVIYLSARIHKLSLQAATLWFIAYSVLTGVVFAPIILAFTGASIAKTFLITAGTFGAMAVIGTTTKRDLSRMGSILTMGIIGLIIAMVVNIFLKSTMMDFIISGAGVLIFTGLTAWDVQNIKKQLSLVGNVSESTQKIALLGALNLYLDFINLFLYLLRFFGDRK